MEQLLIAALLADVGIAALVAKRINWLARPPASALPAITLQVVSAQRDYGFKNENPLVRYRVQLSIWATSYLTTTQIRDAVLAFANGLTGTPFPRPELLSELDLHDAGDTPSPGAQPSPAIYAKHLDLEVTHRPAS
jgi:hypothetical protein